MRGKRFSLPYKRMPPSLSLLKYLVARSSEITVEMIMMEEKTAAFKIHEPKCKPKLTGNREYLMSSIDNRLLFP
jgi:hypothetical protein